MPTTKPSAPELEKITRIVLIIGIISVSGAIIYTLTLPEEEDLLFFVLNEDQALRDYPTNSTVDESLILYTFIQNSLGEPYNFTVNVFLCENTTIIDPQQSLFQNPHAEFYINQSKLLDNKEEWISNPFSIEFDTPGQNQIIGFELWIYEEGIWTFKSNYILTIHIDIF